MWRLDLVPKQGRTFQIKVLLGNFEGDVWLCHFKLWLQKIQKKSHHGNTDSIMEAICAQKWPWPHPQWAQNLIWYTFSDHIHSTYPSTLYLCHTPSLLFSIHNLLKKVSVCVWDPFFFLFIKLTSYEQFWQRFCSNCQRCKMLHKVVHFAVFVLSLCNGPSPPYGTSSKQQQLFCICNGILFSLPNKPTTVEHNNSQ